MDFRDQMLEDFEEYRKRYPNIKNIEKDEWAFNFWILDNLFSIDEDVIEENITDYNDKGVDCYVWHEDLRDLYLIQNKFYADDTKITNDYVQNDFLTRSIGALEKGTYSRNQTLQDIFNKYSGEDDFSVHLYLYVTNNSAKTQSIVDGIAHFNEVNSSKKYDAKIFDLDDIQEQYYKEPIRDNNSFKYTLSTINKGTILNVDNEAYKLTLALDARYVLVPVVVLYEMYKAAEHEKYPLFDENIREYLGSTGNVNKKIKATLNDSEDRNNFFFYNNGITMIVSDMAAARLENGLRVFEVYNPQIVNGCQTVSTIYETLSSLPESSLKKEFESTYVMVKILKIPSNDDNLKDLYKNIVTYNNSQNSINEKYFNAAQDVFRHVQSILEWRGLLICIKQSDKNKYKNTYKTATKLLNLINEDLQKFGIENYNKTTDFIIELEKLLQVILAFVSSPQDAIQNKSKLLKDNSIQNAKVIEFIKSTEKTDNDLYNLLLLYLRAEEEKKTEGRFPNPFYLIHCFGHYDCEGNPGRISGLLDSKDKVEKIVKKYKIVTHNYYQEWTQNNPGKEYNDMIKSPLDMDILDRNYKNAEYIINNF